MAIIRFSEAVPSRSFNYGSKNTKEIIYTLITDGDETEDWEVEQWLRDNAPQNIVLITGLLLYLKDVAVTNRAWTVWEGICRYEMVATFPTTNTVERTFSARGASFHIDTALSVVAQYGTTPTAAMDPTIGVQANAPARGLDIDLPVGSFSRVGHFSNDSFTTAFERQVLSMVGGVNNGPFFGWQPGEVKFAGIDGRQRGVTDWEVNYNFLIQQNNPAFVIGNLPAFSKDGWDYVDPYYQAQQITFSDNTSRTFFTLLYVKVLRVSPRVDFSQLGIGVM